jgi:hypothetical protein
VPLPETIETKYTEEQAEYLSMTPVVRQTFLARELVDMMVQTVGKDVRRVRHVLRAGTVVFRTYRYWWDGFDADAAELNEILATYPDAEPSRVFSAESCTEVILESSGSPPRHSLRIKRAEAKGKSGVLAFLRAGNFWDALMKLGEPGKIHYREYSYGLRADVYARALTADDVVRLAAEANRQASRDLRGELIRLPSVSQVVFICPR